MFSGVARPALNFNTPNSNRRSSLFESPARPAVQHRAVKIDTANPKKQLRCRAVGCDRRSIWTCDVCRLTAVKPFGLCPPAQGVRWNRNCWQEFHNSKNHSEQIDTP